MMGRTTAEENMQSLVADLNANYFETTYDDELSPFSYETNGCISCLYFMDEIVWDTEYDAECDNLGNEIDYHKMKTLVLRRALDIASRLERAIRKMWNEDEEKFYERLCFGDKN
jgi:hypothetical protein